MKKFLNVFFVTLGVIFFILILIGSYFYVTDPLNLKPLLFGDTSESAGDNQQDANPNLSESQEKTLKTFGIDPAKVPTTITPEQEACFVSKIGAGRVAEIKAGASPTAAEYFASKECM